MFAIYHSTQLPTISLIALPVASSAKALEADTANPTADTLETISGIFGLKIGFVAASKANQAGDSQVIIQP